MTQTTLKFRLCDTISIPSGHWHNAKALDGRDAEMVICFSSADRETELE